MGVKIFTICFFVVGFTTLVSVASAQTPSRHHRAARCRIGNLAFRCPIGYRPVPLANEKRFALFRAKTEFIQGFFVAPAAGVDENEFVSNLRTALVEKLFPKETPPFEWTTQEGPEKVSKYEIGGGGALGLGRVKAVTLVYRRMKFRDREFWVGGLFDSGGSDEARETLAQGGVRISMGECNAAVQVIYSITGEKEDPENPPCVLQALSQQLP
jgi:hypothetical protein